MMDSLTNGAQTVKTKKKPSAKCPKPAKNIKSNFLVKAGKNLNKSKTQAKTGEKTEFSMIGSAKGNTSKIIQKKIPSSAGTEKVSCIFSQLSLGKSAEKSKNRCISGHSFRSNKKKENFLAHALKEKKFILKAKVLSGLDCNHGEKTTPRPVHPSPSVRTEPKDLMWTPEQIRGGVTKSVSTISDKKKKRPEIGYYIKRFSLHDINKTLYSDQDISKISFDTPKKMTSEVSFIDPQGNISDIIKVSTPPKDQPQDSQVDISFQSPTRLLRVYSSPEGKFILHSPEFMNSKEEPKAPRKTLAGFESPGSFNFSISSSSSIDYNERGSRLEFQVRHTECQTDLMVPDEDEDIRKGLLLLGKLLRTTN